MSQSLKMCGCTALTAVSLRPTENCTIGCYSGYKCCRAYIHCSLWIYAQLSAVDPLQHNLCHWDLQQTALRDCSGYKWCRAAQFEWTEGICESNHQIEITVSGRVKSTGNLGLTSIPNSSSAQFFRSLLIHRCTPPLNWECQIVSILDREGQREQPSNRDNC